MKAIQITVDEALLARLDADPEVGRDGRSAVIRRAAEEYLRRREKERISAQYRRAYGDGDALAGELEGWEEQGEWPDD